MEAHTASNMNPSSQVEGFIVRSLRPKQIIRRCSCFSHHNALRIYIPSCFQKSLVISPKKADLYVITTLSQRIYLNSTKI